MADGRLNCQKAGPEEGNNQPSTMKTNKKPKGEILQGITNEGGFAHQIKSILVLE